MLGLSMLDPWSMLVAISAKRNETRSWPAPPAAKGRIAIHSSKHCKRAESELFHVPAFYDALVAAGITHWDALPRGAIIATVDLVGCHPTEEIAARLAPDDPELLFGDYTPGRWAWTLERPVRLLEPIPCKGRLGLWTVPPELLTLIPESAR